MSYMQLTKDNQAEARQLVKTHQCSECCRPLKISRLSGTREFIVMCSLFPHHQGYTRIARDSSLVEMTNLLKGKGIQMDSNALVALGPTGMTKRVEQVNWPSTVTSAAKKMIAEISLTYGLDPLFDEIMPYQGRPYVTISARRRKAQETGELDGIETRPATQQERLDRGTDDGDYCAFATVWKKGSSHPFTAFGKVTSTEIERAKKQAANHGRQTDTLPLVKDPLGMAEKRAEALALKRAFYIPLPSAEDISPYDESSVIDSTAAVVVDAPDESGPQQSTEESEFIPATNEQFQALYASAKEIGWKKDEVISKAKARYQVNSLRELSSDQVQDLTKIVSAGGELPGPEEE